MRAVARRLIAVTAASAVLAGGVTASAAEPAPSTARPLAGLRVLLTNDDSMRAAKARTPTASASTNSAAPSARPGRTSW